MCTSRSSPQSMAYLSATTSTSEWLRDRTELESVSVIYSRTLILRMALLLKCHLSSRTTAGQSLCLISMRSSRSLRSCLKLTLLTEATKSDPLIFAPTLILEAFLLQKTSTISLPSQLTWGSNSLSTSQSGQNTSTGRHFPKTGARKETVTRMWTCKI